jgi:hypothetical protein
MNAIYDVVFRYSTAYKAGSHPSIQGANEDDSTVWHKEFRPRADGALAPLLVFNP